MTGIWRWILLYVLALVVLQVLVYYYIQRGGDRGVPSPTASNGGRAGAAEEKHGPTEEWPSAATRGDGDRASPAAEGSIRCPHCGTTNDLEANYRFCRYCVRELNVR